MKKLLLSLIGLIVALGLAELVVRVVAPQPTGPQMFAVRPALGEVPAPGQSGVRTLPGVYRYAYTNNSLGLRGAREYGGKTKPRILFLGDSFTYGVGVDDDETFSAVMERALDGSVEVVNAGNPDKGTDYELKFWRTVGQALHPDEVWVFFFQNDPTDNRRHIYYAPEGDGLAEQEPRTTVPLRQALSGSRIYDAALAHSHFFNLLKRTVQSALTRGATQPPVLCPDTDPDHAATRYTADLLTTLASEVRATGAKARFFYVPDERDMAFFRNQGEASACETQIKEMFAAAGLLLTSFTPLLASQDGPTSDWYFIEGHWKRNAQALVGEVLPGIFRSSDR